MINYPNYPGLTTPSLLELHNSIQKAMAEDDKRPEGQKMYGVREFPDWRQHADGIEKELDKRNVKYQALNWGKR